MKIIIASGGTLGHLTPILPIVELLKYEKNEIYLYTSKKQVVNNFYKTNNYFTNITFYETKGINKRIISTIKTNLKAYRQIKKDLGELKPDIVIGMGGYVSGIVIKAAHNLGLKTITYEQNSIIGKANKMCLKYSDKFIYSYENLKIPKKYKTIKYYLINPRQEYTREQIKLYHEKYNQILITSGSLGSEKINETIIQVIKNFPEYKFIMVSGERYYKEFSEIKKNNKIDNLLVIPSTDNLVKYILESKIIISRAGATTISELIGGNKLAIYIPSPNVTANHQVKNVKFIYDNELGIVLYEKNLSVEELTRLINLLLEHQDAYKRRLEVYNQQKSINKFITIIKEMAVWYYWKFNKVHKG